jgi:hypothetical protein
MRDDRMFGGRFAKKDNRGKYDDDEEVKVKWMCQLLVELM